MCQCHLMSERTNYKNFAGLEWTLEYLIFQLLIAGYIIMNKAVDTPRCFTSWTRPFFDQQMQDFFPKDSELSSISTPFISVMLISDLCRFTAATNVDISWSSELQGVEFSFSRSGFLVYTINESIMSWSH